MPIVAAVLLRSSLLHQGGREGIVQRTMKTNLHRRFSMKTGTAMKPGAQLLTPLRRHGAGAAMQMTTLPRTMLTTAGVGPAMMRAGIVPRLGAGGIIIVKGTIGIMGGGITYPQLPLLGGAGWKKVTKACQLPTMVGAGATKAAGKSGLTGPNKTKKTMSWPPATAGAAMTAQIMTGIDEIQQ